GSAEWATKRGLKKSIHGSTRPAECFREHRGGNGCHRLCRHPLVDGIGSSCYSCCPGKRPTGVWTWGGFLPLVSRIPELWIMRAWLSTDFTGLLGLGSLPFF